MCHPTSRVVSWRRLAGLAGATAVTAALATSTAPAMAATNAPGIPPTAKAAAFLTPSVGAIQLHYDDLGGPAGFLGGPLGGEMTTPDGIGRFTEYEHGAIYWTPATGAHEVHGGIRAEWAATGWERGPLGYPVTDETGTPDGVGRFNNFQSGSVYWTPATGAHEVHGAIGAKWAAAGWERGPLGYPVTDEYAVPGGRASDFQHGRISWNAATGDVTVLPQLSISVRTERNQLGGWIYVSGIGFSPTNTVHLFAEGLVGRNEPMQIGSDSTGPDGRFDGFTYDARCWAGQREGAVIRAVDALTGMSTTGTTSAFSCG